MTLQEAVEAVRQAGGELVLLPTGRARVRGKVGEDVLATLRADRDRVVALLRLRDLHRRLGLTEDDVLFIEDAVLSGNVHDVRLVVAAPAGMVA